MSETSSSNPVAMESRARSEQRLHSPSAGRNKSVIAKELAAVLPANAAVLEIGSGTGEHAVAACQAREDISWYPSDPDAQSRDSQDAWAKACPGRIHTSRSLDASRADWTNGLPEVDAIVCCNVIHIAPWRVAEGLAAGAETLLASRAPLVLYGPFLEGEKTAPSNLDFDASLRSRNPDWGVRDRAEVEGLFARHGFQLEKAIIMPANNLMLVFRKTAT